MTVVGYLEDCFIIRNSWGQEWGDNGYYYYYYKDWGKHWELWTTIDIKGSKYINNKKEKIKEEKIKEEEIKEEEIKEEESKEKKYNKLYLLYKYVINFFKYLKTLLN